MSSDDPPPQPATVRARSLVFAVLALLGVVLAVAGADTTVTDVTGAAPIVDDAARQDPAQCEQIAQDVDDWGRTSGVEAPLGGCSHRCTETTEGIRIDRGCSPTTLRGPPGA